MRATGRMPQSLPSLHLGTSGIGLPSGMPSALMHCTLPTSCAKEEALNDEGATFHHTPFVIWCSRPLALARSPQLGVFVFGVRDFEFAFRCFGALLTSAVQG
jgi:hypothetical protein